MLSATMIPPLERAHTCLDMVVEFVTPHIHSFGEGTRVPGLPTKLCHWRCTTTACRTSCDDNAVMRSVATLILKELWGVSSVALSTVTSITQAHGKLWRFVTACEFHKLSMQIVSHAKSALDESNPIVAGGAAWFYAMLREQSNHHLSRTPTPTDVDVWLRDRVHIPPMISLALEFCRQSEITPVVVTMRTLYRRHERLFSLGDVRVGLTESLLLHNMLTKLLSDPGDGGQSSEASSWTYPTTSIVVDCRLPNGHVLQFIAPRHHVGDAWPPNQDLFDRDGVVLDRFDIDVCQCAAVLDLDSEHATPTINVTSEVSKEVLVGDTATVCRMPSNHADAQRLHKRMSKYGQRGYTLVLQCPALS